MHDYVLFSPILSLHRLSLSLSLFRSFDYEDDFEGEAEEEIAYKLESAKKDGIETSQRSRPKSAKSANSEPQDTE